MLPIQAVNGSTSRFAFHLITGKDNKWDHYPSPGQEHFYNMTS